MVHISSLSHLILVFGLAIITQEVPSPMNIMRNPLAYLVHYVCAHVFMVYKLLPCFSKSKNAYQLRQILISISPTSSTLLPLAPCLSRAALKQQFGISDYVGHRQMKTSWASYSIPVILVTYVLVMWVGSAIWEARKYNDKEPFRTRLIRGLCCGGRRDRWHRRCQHCRKFHYCQECADSERDMKAELPYIE
jgi:hypothetical protein